MKAYKLEILVIDFDQLGLDGVQHELENTRFANDCLYPHVLGIQEADIGEWTDDHPLNQKDTMKAHAEHLFRPPFRGTMMPNPNPNCSCRDCNKQAWWMIVCDTCGNKRCPHAANHLRDCTNSNALGQPGSDY